MPVALLPVLPTSSFLQKAPGVLGSAIVAGAGELVALLTGLELADVVGCDVGELDFEFCGELAGVPEDVSEFFDDVVFDGWVVAVSVELLPLVGNLSGFSDEAEDAVVDTSAVVETGAWVDGRSSGVFLVVVKGISAGTSLGRISIFGGLSEFGVCVLGAGGAEDHEGFSC